MLEYRQYSLAPGCECKGLITTSTHAQLSGKPQSSHVTESIVGEMPTIGQARLWQKSRIQN